MNYMAKMNEAVDMKNSFTMDGGGKRVVRPFNKKVFWKRIGRILLAVTYGNKGHKIFREIQEHFFKIAPTKL